MKVNQQIEVTEDQYLECKAYPMTFFTRKEDGKYFVKSATPLGVKVLQKIIKNEKV